MIQKLAVAAVAAAVLALEAALLHVSIAAPLESAFGELRDAARPGTFEETIVVVGDRATKRG